jgi:ABC-type glycerol-3-phosphate transport system substrate-binding protein
MSKKLNVLIALIIAMAMVLGACAPQTIVQTVEVEKEVVKTVEVEKEVVTTVEVEKVVEVTAMPEEPKGDKTLIVWWSHWANEPAKRLVIEQIVKDYEAEHNDVDIVLTWWDKNPLRDAIRSTMTAGEGAPDITTFDSEVVEWVEAGWLVDLADTLPWENLAPAAKQDGTYPDVGFPGNYKFNLSATNYMILYNPDIFAELGVEVPENFQFTQQEFLDVVQKCSDAGYAGVADAIGNRPYPATYLVEYPLFNLVGPEQFNAYTLGQQSWDTPEARAALEYSVALRDAGVWPESFATMTIDEFHVYFHTQRKSCMLFIPTWYTGRSFKSVAEGGQDPDWHPGMLRYPVMDGCQACDTLKGGFESGYAVLSSTKHPEVAKDILAFFAQPKYGALWTAVTNSPSIILYDPATDWPSDELLTELGQTPGMWDWYWEEYNKVYGPLDIGIAFTTRCGEFTDAYTSAINEGLPQSLITVDEAVEMLDSALCQ